MTEDIVQIGSPVANGGGALFEMETQRRAVMHSEVKPRRLLVWSTAQNDADISVTALPTMLWG